jgi:hypothetical protein
MADFTPGTFYNDYILGFAERARQMSEVFNQNSGVYNYVIWNEPNNTDPEKAAQYLDAEHFAALLLRCRQVMETRFAPRLYWGGVIFGPGNGALPDQNSLDYVDAVYEALYSRGLAGGEYGSWPWTGINVHIHHAREEGHIANLFDGFEFEVSPGTWVHIDGVNEIRSRRGDYGDMIVGEWGESRERYDADPGTLSRLYDDVRQHANIMFYFSHHEQPEAETWGLRITDISGSAYVLGTPYPGLYAAYDSLVGT